MIYKHTYDLQDMEHHTRQTAEGEFKAKKVNREISRLKKRDFKAKYRPNKQKQ